jgi:hypothetical protein
MTNWKPISSAPRDGTEILITYKYYGKWYILSSWWEPNLEWWARTNIYPTHWAKLPEPPKDEVWDSFGKWKGGDCDECLEFVKGSRSKIDVKKKSIRQLAKEYGFDERSKEDKRRSFELATNGTQARMK